MARRLGDILARVRYRGDSFVVERNGTPVARLTPLPDVPVASLGEALAGWSAAGEPDPDFAEVLEQVGAADRPPGSPWDSSSTRVRSSR